MQSLTVRPDPSAALRTKGLVEACHELDEWGGRLSRLWFDKALLSKVEGLTTNGLTLNCPALSGIPDSA